MNRSSIVAILLCASLSGCGSDAKAEAVGDKARKLIEKLAGSVQDQLQGLNASLLRVTDGQSAQAAKAKLEALAVVLTKSDLVGVMRNANGTVLTFAHAAQTQIERLLANEEVKAAIGPVLQQLQAAIGKAD